MGKFGATTILKQRGNMPEGFSIMEGDLLRKYQLSLLEMAHDIIRVCEKEHVSYNLGGGTALGAVRHGGFIPWDDDVDIFILRSDYERFCESFLHEYKNLYVIKDENTPNFDYPHGTIERKGSYIKTILGEGCFSVDIFFYENIPDNLLLRALHGFLCLSAGLLFSCRRLFDYRRLYHNAMKMSSPAIRCSISIRIVIGWIAHIFPLDFCRKLTCNIYGLCKNNHSKCLTVPTGAGGYFKRIFPREEFVNSVKKPFEGYEWNVMRGYDLFLTQRYGSNYMQVPPPEKREYHYYSDIKFPENPNS